MVINIEMLDAFLRSNDVTFDELAKFIRRVRQRKEKVTRKAKDRYGNEITIDDIASEIGSNLINATILSDDNFIKHIDCINEEDLQHLLWGITLFLQALQKFRTHVNNNKTRSELTC